MDYINPIHTPVLPNQHSPFQVLSGAVRGNYGPPFLSPTRKRVPQPAFAPSGKWKSVIKCPLITKPITFDYIGYSGQGVPMRELSSRSAIALAAMIHGSNDPVFACYGLKRITLRIIWPGYEHIEWARSIDLFTSHGPITRGQVGAAIASNFARFIEKTQYEATRSLDWRVGSGGIGIEHVHLISLWNVCDDAWQAEIAIDMR